MTSETSTHISRTQQYIDDECSYDPQLKKLLLEVLKKEKEYQLMKWRIEAEKYSCEGFFSATSDWPLESFAALCRMRMEEVIDLVCWNYNCE